MASWGWICQLLGKCHRHSVKKPAGRNHTGHGITTEKRGGYIMALIFL